MTAKDPTYTYKIGGPRPTEIEGNKNDSNSDRMSNQTNQWTIVKNDFGGENEKKEQEKREKLYEKPKSVLEQRIESLAQKKKNDVEKLLNLVDDPLSSSRPVTLSPSKPIFASSTTNNNQLKPFTNFPPPQPSKQNTFFPPPSKSK